MLKSNWRRIAFVSCLHAGSTVAVWPEIFDVGDGIEICASQKQLQILEYWNDFWSHEAADADTIVLMGDLVQGKNPKDFGLGSMTTDLQVQEDAAIALIGPHVNGRQVIGVSGSKYHDSFDTALDKNIIRRLGGRYMGMLKNIKVTGPDVMMNIAHGSSSPSMYKGSHDDRELMLADSCSTTRGINLMVRGHWHYYQYLENSSNAILRVPGWQCWYPARFMIDMLGKKNNKFGAVTVDIGPSRNVVHRRLYEAPETWSAPEEI